MSNTNAENRITRTILPRKKGYIVVLLIMALAAVAFMAMMTLVNAFPAKLVGIALAVLFGMIALAWLLFSRKSKPLRIVGIALAAIYLTVFGLGSYYLGTTFVMFAKISGDGEGTRQVNEQGIDVTQDSFNIYITGIDQWNKEKGLDLERSDVNMIVTVCPKVRRVLLTSIPRDSYVPLHRTGTYDKLTHTGVYGVDETLNTVEDWLGIDLNYYVKMNFSSARDIVNAIGGIDVYSPVAFKSSISEYKYVEGINHLDGKAALYFARERKSFEGKDSIRVENQQRVVKACIEKLTSSTTLLTKYGDIINAAGKSFKTSMDGDDMQALVKMQLSDLTGWEIETQKFKGDYDMDYVASLTQEQQFLVYKIKPKSLKSCVEAIDKTMNPTQEEIDAYHKMQKEAAARGLLDQLRNLVKRK